MVRVRVLEWIECPLWKSPTCCTYMLGEETTNGLQDDAMSNYYKSRFY